MPYSKKKFVKKIEWVPTDDQSKVYERSIEVVYSNINGSNRTLALDIGCNLGRHSVAMIPFFKQVLAFDAHIPDEFRRVAADHSEHISVYEFALGARHENLNFYFNSKEPSLSSFLEGFHSNCDEVLQLEVKPLDSFELSNVGFIKLDVEGFELDVLEGGRLTIKESSPVIYLEGAQKALGEDYKDFFSSINYELVSLSRGWVPIGEKEKLNRDCLAYSRNKIPVEAKEKFLEYYQKNEIYYSRWKS